jgi:hypothetical protein
VESPYPECEVWLLDALAGRRGEADEAHVMMCQLELVHFQLDKEEIWRRSQTYHAAMRHDESNSLQSFGGASLLAKWVIEQVLQGLGVLEGGSRPGEKAHVPGELRRDCVP